MALSRSAALHLKMVSEAPLAAISTLLSRMRGERSRTLGPVRSTTSSSGRLATRPSGLLALTLSSRRPSRASPSRLSLRRASSPSRPLTLVPGRSNEALPTLRGRPARLSWTRPPYPPPRCTSTRAWRWLSPAPTLKLSLESHSRSSGGPTRAPTSRRRCGSSGSATPDQAGSERDDPVHPTRGSDHVSHDGRRRARMCRQVAGHGPRHVGSRHRRPGHALGDVAGIRAPQATPRRCPARGCPRPRRSCCREHRNHHPRPSSRRRHHPSRRRRSPDGAHRDDLVVAGRHDRAGVRGAVARRRPRPRCRPRSPRRWPRGWGRGRPAGTPPCRRSASPRCSC